VRQGTLDIAVNSIVTDLPVEEKNKRKLYELYNIMYGFKTVVDKAKTVHTSHLKLL